MAARHFTFGLLGFVAFCVTLSIVVGLVGRQWLRQILPTVSIEDPSTAEGDPLNYTIRLSETSQSPVAVRFATRDRTARAGEDYVAIVPTTVIFAPGEAWKEVVVETLMDDDEGEGDESLSLELLGAAGAVIEKRSGSGNILDGLAPADVAITRFYGDGKDLRIDYTVKGGSDGRLGFLVCVHHNGDYGGSDLVSGTAEWTRGRHTITLSPDFDDRPQDYTLMAMADSEYAIDERDENNNFIRFDGGSFIAREPASGKTVLHIHGRDQQDSTFDLTPQIVDEVHFRGRGGDDHFDLNRLRPGMAGWMFGGQGNDTLIGSSAADVIFGGPGTDTLRGGDGRDLLVGGNDRDKLYGGTGEDELFGGPDNDMLFDTDDNTRFDGGPGGDLFNDRRLNPAAKPAHTTFGDYYRDAEDERELRIDLASGFANFVKAFPEHQWSVECHGPAIAAWSVKGDTLHVEFKTAVPDVSQVKVWAAASGAESATHAASGDPNQLAFCIYSIAVTGYKVERRTGTGGEEWTEERGDLWTSDTLRWTPLYEPTNVPIAWNVKWLSKPSEDLDHPHIAWKVFATGVNPIGNLGVGVDAITPQFEFHQNSAAVGR